MNNLHRELAPISDDGLGRPRGGGAAHLHAARGGPPGGRRGRPGRARRWPRSAPATSTEVDARRRRRSRPGPRGPAAGRVPGAVHGRAGQAIDDVARGAKDADWQPVKDAAKQIAFAEDGMVFDGYAAAGHRRHPGRRLQPADRPARRRAATTRTRSPRRMTALRLAGVGGPYTLLLSADAYTAVAETTDHGYPIREHIAAGAGRRGTSSGRRP